MNLWGDVHHHLMKISEASLQKNYLFVATTISKFLAVDVFRTLWQCIGKPCQVTHDMYRWTKDVHEHQDVYMPLTSQEMSKWTYLIRA